MDKSIQDKQDIQAANCCSIQLLTKFYHLFGIGFVCNDGQVTQKIDEMEEMIE